MSAESGSHSVPSPSRPDRHVMSLQRLCRIVVALAALAAIMWTLASSEQVVPQEPPPSVDVSHHRQASFQVNNKIVRILTPPPKYVPLPTIAPKEGPKTLLRLFLYDTSASSAQRSLEMCKELVRQFFGSLQADNPSKSFRVELIVVAPWRGDSQGQEDHVMSLQHRLGDDFDQKPAAEGLEFTVVIYRGTRLRSDGDTSTGYFVLQAVHEYLHKTHPGDSLLLSLSPVLIVDLTRTALCRIPHALMEAVKEHLAGATSKAHLLCPLIGTSNPFAGPLRTNSNRFLRAALRMRGVDVYTDADSYYDAPLPRVANLFTLTTDIDLEKEANVRLSGTQIIGGDDRTIKSLLASLVSHAYFEKSRSLLLPLDVLFTEVLWQLVLRSGDTILSEIQFVYAPSRCTVPANAPSLCEFLLTQQGRREEAREAILTVYNCVTEVPPASAMTSANAAPQVCHNRFRFRSTWRGGKSQVNFIRWRPPPTLVKRMVNDMKPERPRIAAVWDEVLEENKQHRVQLASSSANNSKTISDAHFVTLPPAKNICSLEIETVVLSFCVQCTPSAIRALVHSFAVHHSSRADSCKTALVVVVADADVYYRSYSMIRKEKGQALETTNIVFIDLRLDFGPDKPFWERYAATFGGALTSNNSMCTTIAQRFAYLHAVTDELGRNPEWKPKFVVVVDAVDAVFQGDVTEAIHAEMRGSFQREPSPSSYASQLSFVLFPTQRSFASAFSVHSAENSHEGHRYNTSSVYGPAATAHFFDVVVQRVPETGAETPLPLMSSGHFFGTVAAVRDVLSLSVRTMGALNRCDVVGSPVGIEDGVLLGLVAGGLEYTEYGHEVLLGDPWLSHFTQWAVGRELHWAWLPRPDSMAARGIDERINATASMTLAMVNCVGEAFAIVRQLGNATGSKIAELNGYNL